MTDRREEQAQAANVNTVNSFCVPIPEFSGKREDFPTYADRFVSSMMANNITDDRRIIHILISSMGDDLYRLAHDLFSPARLADQNYKTVIQRLSQHLHPPPSIIIARCNFNRLVQKPEQDVNGFVANLRRVAEDCAYGAHLLMWLRDRLVAGIYNEAIRRRLLQEKSTMTFDEAYKIALAMKTANKEAKAIVGTSVAVNQVGKQLKGNPNSRKEVAWNRPCIRCNATDHPPTKYPYLHTTCNNCKKVGHLQRACRAPRKEGTYNYRQKFSGKKPVSGTKSRSTHLIDVEQNEQEGQDSFSEIFIISSVTTENKAERWTKTLMVDNVELKLEVDSGSGVTLISERTRKDKFPYKELTSTSVRLKAYLGNDIPVVGKLTVSVEIDGDRHELPMIVVKGSGPSLLGRDWLKFMEPWKDMVTPGTIHTTTEVERSKVDELVREFSKVFDEGLGHLQDVEVSLELEPDARPIFCKARTIPLALKDKVEQEIDRMEREGIIEKVKYSLWATPVVPVVKPSGEVRLCGDYKATLNRYLKVETYPIPKIEELLTELQGGEEFTKLDLKHAYQQLRLDVASRKLTTVNTTKGLYQFKRLPYGVSAAPALFQRTIDMLLKDLRGVVVFMDDICVTGKNRQEHVTNLRAVLQTLQEAGLKLRLDKCQFFLKEIEFLGFKVDKEGIHPMLDKVKAIREAPQPRNVAELRSYLGLLNHYAKFMPNLASTIATLYNLLKKGSEWKWSQREQEAFERSKEFLTKDTFLVHYSLDLPVVLSCDASPYSVGAVLQHRTEDGEKPVAYASRKLSETEQRYPQIEKEALAIMFGVTRFRQYLLGREFTLVTDHQPLLRLFSPSKETPQMSASRIKRWSLMLATFQYKIEYRTSKQNAPADGLSRLPLQDVGESLDNNSELVLIIDKFNSELPVTAKQVATETNRDTVLQRVKTLTLEGWPENLDIQNPELKPYFHRRLELSVEQGVILWGTRVIIPQGLRKNLLEELHGEHFGMVRMKSMARAILWWPGLDKDIEKRVRTCFDCQEVANRPAAVPPCSWKWPSSPWSRLHIDYAGPFQGYSFLVVVDAHSKWLEVIPTQSTTSATTIKQLRKLFCTFGLPEHIVTDNGAQFTSDEFQDFLRMNHIHHTRTAPKHPATNGQAERAVESFKLGLKKMKGQAGDIMDKLNRYLFSYRTTPHAVTGKTPAELLMKRHLRTRLSALRPSMEMFMSRKDEPGLSGERFFTVGQPVFAQNWGVNGGKWLAGIIVERHGNRNYEVSVGQSVWKRHVDQLRPREADTREPFRLVDQEPEISWTPIPTSHQPELEDAPASERPASPTVNMPSTKPSPVVNASPRRNPEHDRRRPARYND